VTGQDLANHTTLQAEHDKCDRADVSEVGEEVSGDLVTGSGDPQARVNSPKVRVTKSKVRVNRVRVKDCVGKGYWQEASKGLYDNLAHVFAVSDRHVQVQDEVLLCYPDRPPSHDTHLFLAKRIHE
jgi:hypothetical protein